MLFEETFLIPQFLNQYGPNAGDVVVLYDVTGRKVYFWKHKDSDSDWELLFPPRGYRKSLFVSESPIFDCESTRMGPSRWGMKSQS